MEFGNGFTENTAVGLKKPVFRNSRLKESLAIGYKDKMKILFVSEVYHPTINGVVIAMDTFAQELEKAGHTVYFLVPHNPDFEHRSTRVFTVPAIPIGAKKDYYLCFPSRVTREIVKMIQPDIIHSHHIWAMGMFSVKVSRELKIPLVITYHTLMEAYVHKVRFLSSIRPIKSALVKIIKWQSRRLCNSADLVISPSSAMKKIIRSYGVKAPIEVLATGIELKDFQCRTRDRLLKKLKIKEKGARLLLFVGRLAYEKNLSLLIKAFRLIHQKFPHTHLILLGDGPQKNFYQNLAKKTGVNIIMPGFVDPPEAKTYFCGADIFVFPSITDTQGIVILEAMAGGAVPVAVNRLGPTDIINSGYNGFLVKNDIGEFARTVSKLLQSPRLYHRLQAAGKIKAKHFTNKIQTAKLLALYEKLKIDHRS